MKMKVGVIALFVIAMLSPSFKVEADSGGYIVKLKDATVPVELTEMLTEVNAEHRIYKSDSINQLEDFSEYIEYTETNDEVVLIEGESPASLYSLPRDELYSEQWQTQMINADSAWKMETYGNDIKIAVIDSGCFHHDDLKANLLEGKNYFDGSTDTSDIDGHGTHVSGIIAAENNDFGIIGVAPKAKIVPLKCFENNNASFDIIAEAIYDAVDLFDCQIINMSFGTSINSRTIKEAINYAHKNGLILVAAVGNYGTSTIYYPAGYEEVIGVGSVGSDKEKSEFSQSNKSVTVVAPGEMVKSTSNTNDYEYKQGTSQSAPLVSGMAAILVSMDDNISNEDFKRILIEFSDDIGQEGYDTVFGYGILNGVNYIDFIQKNIKYYVSPINQSTNGSYVYIKNNTNEPLEAISIFACYENYRMKNCKISNLTLMPTKEIILHCEYEDYSTSHFLWESVNNIKPLTSKKER